MKSFAGEDLAIYALYISIFINPINVLVEFTEMLQKGLAGFQRFNEVMETMPEITDSPDAIELDKDADLLDFLQELPEGFNTLVGERGARLSILLCVQILSIHIYFSSNRISGTRAWRQAVSYDIYKTCI